MTQHLITEPAKAAECTRCGDPVFAAITGGLTTITDIHPLSVNEEITALLTGRPTFDLQSSGKQAYLEWRDITRIKAGRHHPVVAAHQCGPGTLLLPVTIPPVEELPDDPPF